ncbi:hypothetical protein QJS10_CPA01g00629 [Acorus calamus]|uniref:Reverse transcriptase domain-containing protein n=1 Tax=Acorus calamus TaxID=4465 RepID=A0AAV9FEQ6_ACOCL|nr:hypothetical protein QJS10_CPA01g00629 [Acorus calamus]
MLDFEEESGGSIQILAPSLDCFPKGSSRPIQIWVEILKSTLHFTWAIRWQFDATTVEHTLPEAEIESAVRRLPSNRAPGPDGFPGEFYKAFWPIIRGDVIRAIHHFHQTAQLPPSWGSTHVVLIPKNSSPSTLKDYRPISICDTKYKLIAKLLVMRLKKVLPVLVGQEQGAFVLDRSIHSHLLLVQEIMHSLRCRRGKYTLMAAKIDLQSAYDSVEWNCLTQVLQHSVHHVSTGPECRVVTRISTRCRQEATAQKATEKITKRLETWKSSSLNIAGRVVLIRAVLQTLPQHLMFAASLMRTDAEEIDRLARRFFWAGGRTERVIHYINWERVTSEKAAGGLGIRRTPILRVASLAIMAYRVLLRPSMVQQVFGLKYKWSGNPWELPRAQRSSRNWRRLCEGLTLIRQHVRKISGSFTEVDLLRDPWFMPVPFSRLPIFVNMDSVILDFKLSDVIHNGSWSQQNLARIFPPFWVDCIMQSSLPEVRIGDHEWCWESTPTTKPRVRDMYQLLLPSPNISFTPLWKGIWRLPVFP